MPCSRNMFIDLYSIVKKSYTNQYILAYGLNGQQTGSLKAIQGLDKRADGAAAENDIYAWLASGRGSPGCRARYGDRARALRCARR